MLVPHHLTTGLYISRLEHVGSQWVQCLHLFRNGHLCPRFPFERFHLGNFVEVAGNLPDSNSERDISSGSLLLNIT